MIKEAIDKILALAMPNQITEGNLLYVDKQMNLVTPPVAGPVHVSTLQGLSDLFASQLDDVQKKGEILAHITSATTVELISRESDDYGRRRVWAKATYPSHVKIFPFGQWLNLENFIILAQSGFQRAMLQNDDGTMAQDLDYVIKMASSISAEAIDVSEDDGITQKVSARRGIVLKETANLKSRVVLAPFRTFAEIDQQLATFVFRARLSDEEMHLALFEADGGRWHLSAVAAIADWLCGELGDTPIIS